MTIEKEILKYSYWEHFKRAKELALIFPLNHPERVAIEKEMKVMAKELTKENVAKKYDHDN